VSFKPKPGQEFYNTKEAAEVFGCSMGRIRQLALAGDLWSDHVHGRALVYDKAEVDEKAKVIPSTGRPRKNRKSA